MKNIFNWNKFNENLLKNEGDNHKSALNLKNSINTQRDIVSQQGKDW